MTAQLVQSATPHPEHPPAATAHAAAPDAHDTTLAAILRGENPTALERLIFFSDAVFAIAITLLALEIRLPEGAGALGDQILALAPNILAFILSFLVIGSYWVAHHRICQYLARYDTGLLWHNLLFLMGIALMPFTSGLIARHGDTTTAVAFYAATLTLAGAFLSAFWLHATRRGLALPDLPPRLIRAHTLRLLSAPTLFLSSIALAFVNPYLAEASWLLLLVIRPVARHLGEEAAPAT